MSFATLSQAYDRKAKSKVVINKMKTTLKNEATHTKEPVRPKKTLKNASGLIVDGGWEYFLNPLEYE
jgi:hypothetical protein